MSKKLGFIGAGNMAKAMMGGIIKNKIISFSCKTSILCNSNK